MSERYRVTSRDGGTDLLIGGSTAPARAAECAAVGFDVERQPPSRTPDETAAHPWHNWPVAEEAKPEAPLATLGDAMQRAQRESPQAKAQRKKRARHLKRWCR